MFSSCTRLSCIALLATNLPLYACMPCADAAHGAWRNLAESTLFPSYQDRPTSKTLVVIPGNSRREETVTLTSLPSSQTPITTDVPNSQPDTTGSIITSLNTEGRPPVQPFPTSLPNVTASTLSPTDITAVPVNSSTTLPPLSVTATITLPLSTFTTVVFNSTVASLPIPTVINISSITVIESSVTLPDTTIVASTVVPTVLETTATVLTRTTLAVSATITGTASTVVSTGTLASILPTSQAVCQFSMKCNSQDLFEPVAVGQPPSNIPRVGGHPVPRLGIQDTNGPISTNKFYSNFFLGSQSFPAFVLPYSLTWSKGGGNAQSWGMSVSHVDDNQKVFGPNNNAIPGAPASYFINPLGIQSIIFSAAELGESTVLTTDSLEFMSGNANLAPTLGAPPKIRFPMVQGMAFVTAIYDSAQPEVQSSVFFRAVEALGETKTGVYKYKLTLEDGKIWILYAAPTFHVDPNLRLISSTLLQGIPGWSGILQVAKLPVGADERILDESSGVYPVSGAVAGYGTEDDAQYSLSWAKSGPYANDATLLMYALPHHLTSFDSVTAPQVRPDYKLQTPTKGTAIAVVADYWILNEQLHPEMGFTPWAPDMAEFTKLPDQVIGKIQGVAAMEASQNMSAQTNLNSMYFSGKALSKFATIVYTMNSLSNQQGLAASALNELKAAFAVFIENRQIFPLYYDTEWKGIVSSASYVTGDPGVDFGNSYYNDHHFHYGYFIHAAALIGSIDSAWAQANKEYINTLIRDVANPSSIDQSFPIFRAFDFYNGHSWAKGVFESGDGKDQESTSEDAMFAYGLKMWGRIIGDTSMERRGDLMLSIVTRAIQSYFLMDSDNKNQPANFIDNKVTGILFENKCDHVTYFGANFEFVQGIQMIPALPFSTLTRTKKFVKEEWDLYFADGAVTPANNVLGGWRGILFGNLAIINPRAAYNFFSQDNFDPSWLDGGASLTWYLAYTAGLGGGS